MGGGWGILQSYIFHVNNIIVICRQVLQNYMQNCLRNYELFKIVYQKEEHHAKITRNQANHENHANLKF